jgi:hypothetical protein
VIYKPKPEFMRSITCIILMSLLCNIGFTQTPIFVAQEKNKYGYIDENGKYLIQPIFEYAGPFYHDRAIAKQSGKFGLINTKGEFVVKPMYEEAVFHAPEGKFTVKSAGKWGVIDVSGNVIIPFAHNYLSIFNEGYIVAVNNINQAKGFKGSACPSIYNEKGQLVISADDCEDDIYFLPGTFNSKYQYSLGGWPMVREGKLILVESGFYDEIMILDIKSQKMRGISSYEVVDNYYGFKEGLLAVAEVEDGFSKRGYYIDVSGSDDYSYKNVFDDDYDYVHPFFNGVAAVEKDNKWSFIDREGKLISETSLSTDTYSVATPMHFNGLVGFFYNKKAGFIDLQGNVVIPFQFDEYHPFEHDVTPVKFKGKYGLIRKDGSWAVEPKFKYIMSAPCPCYE